MKTIIYHGSYEIVQYPNIIVGKKLKILAMDFIVLR